jgi:hypothetical protein
MNERTQCNWCGDFIHPIDWCDDCQKGDCVFHRRDRKRADARYCGPECRQADAADLAAIRNVFGIRSARNGDDR